MLAGTISLTLRLRKYNGQVSKIPAGIKVINKVIGLGMLLRQSLSLWWNSLRELRLYPFLYFKIDTLNEAAQLSLYFN